MKAKKTLFYLLAAILGGCIPVMSLHPLYTDQDLVFEEKLLGTWIDDSNNIWEFKDPNEQGKIYELIVVDDEGKKGSFAAHLVKLQNTLFLDVYPNKLPCKSQDPEDMQWSYNAFLTVGVHTFMKVNSTEPQLKMQLTDDDELKKLLNEDPNAVEHTWLEDGKLVLTASTKELQAFVLKYADDKRVFIDETVLTRRKTTAADESKGIAPKNAEPNEALKADR